MFDNNFEVYLADTEESKNIHYGIRYQVYCEEMGFEDEKKFPQQMEYDDDDAKSIHFIVKNKITGQWVGAMRLIYKHDNLLPIEKACTIDEKHRNQNDFETVEVSRLCLVKGARRGVNPPVGDVEKLSSLQLTSQIKNIPTQHKLNRLIIWGMIHVASEYCYNMDIKYCHLMTTSVLARVLARGGMDLISIGKSCQHRGERFPYKIDAIAAFQNKMWEAGFKNSYQYYSGLDISSAA